MTESREEGDFRAMPAAIPGAVGAKWVNVHPKNISKGLPPVMALLIYNDSGTGYPLAIMNATDSTGIAIKDLDVAKLIYEKAKQSSSYITIDLIEGS